MEWSDEPEKVRQFLELLAEIAKIVHPKVFPDFKHQKKSKPMSRNYHKKGPKRKIKHKKRIQGKPTRIVWVPPIVSRVVTSENDYRRLRD